MHDFGATVGRMDPIMVAFYTTIAPVPSMSVASRTLNVLLANKLPHTLRPEPIRLKPQF